MNSTSTTIGSENASELAPFYEPVIVPALLKIQRRYGFLPREALQELSKGAGIPLHRLQAVASYFPHFRFEQDTQVVVHVCRDMACKMAGSGEALADLLARPQKDVTVKGVSCLGRCDRAPAACVAWQGEEHERIYTAQTAEGLRSIINSCLEGKPPKAHHDESHPCDVSKWLVDPYFGIVPKFMLCYFAIAFFSQVEKFL